MREDGKLHMFLLFLAGVLASVMIAMMWQGGSVNFQEFLSGGDVYDVSPMSLKQSTRKWAYDEAKQGYWLLKKKAGRYFDLNGQEKSWNYLYLTIRESTAPTLSGYVKYYGPDREERYEQPVELHVGENIIPLNEGIPMVEMSIVFRKAKGQFVALSEIQLRTTPRFPISSLVKRFVAVFPGVMVFLLVLLYLRRRFIKVGTGKRMADVLLGSLQEVIRTGGNAVGSRTGGRLYVHQQESVRKFLFSVLIVWMMAGNVLGWLDNAEAYRYHVLVCALLLLAIAFVSWEKPLKNPFWHGALMKSWLCLWLGVILCDFFVYRQQESIAGVSMLLSGSVFIYFWQNMARPGRMFRNLMEALEITFFLGIVYCVIFRMKLSAIDYNGMFGSPEELAMYGVLMEAVFLSDMEGMLSDKIAGWSANGAGNAGKGIFTACVKNIVGLAASLFFVLRSSHMPGILIFILLGVLHAPFLMVKSFRLAKRYRLLFVHMLTATVLAFVCASGMFVGIKYVPEMLDMSVIYGNELHLTKLQGTEKKMYLLEHPKSLNGARAVDSEKLPIIQRSYARRLNLFGHGGTEIIFHLAIRPYNAYLDMAYHHGIFILLPYLAFQITMVSMGLYFALRKKGRRNMFLLSLGIAYICFSFVANVEIPWGHPLWLCFYLSAGCMGKKEIEENLGKEGLT